MKYINDTYIQNRDSMFKEVNNIFNNYMKEGTIIHGYNKVQQKRFVQKIVTATKTLSGDNPYNIETTGPKFLCEYTADNGSIVVEKNGTIDGLLSNKTYTHVDDFDVIDICDETEARGYICSMIREITNDAIDPRF